jgi:hypothetical protein
MWKKNYIGNVLSVFFGVKLGVAEISDPRMRYISRTRGLAGPWARAHSPTIATTETDFPTLRLWAFDTLAIPAMSAEYERIFSSTEKLITPERNRLHEQIIEASECLKN